MSYEGIKVGDEVVCGEVGDHQGTIFGTVRHIPQATGECWVIENDYDIFYVQQFGYIRKKKPVGASSKERHG